MGRAEKVREGLSGARSDMGRADMSRKVYEGQRMEEAMKAKE